jgi:hypothetical protein
LELMAEIAGAGDQPTPTMRRLWDADPFLRETARLLFGATATATASGRKVSAGAAIAKDVRGKLRTDLVARRMQRPSAGERSAANEG